MRSNFLRSKTLSASKCSDRQDCEASCVWCFLKYTHKAELYSRQNPSEYTNSQFEQEKRTKSFFAAHSIQVHGTEKSTKKHYFLPESVKFTTVEALLFAWRGSEGIEVPAYCFWDFQPINSTHGPFAPAHIVKKLFKPIMEEWNVTDEEALRRLGAKPTNHVVNLRSRADITVTLYPRYHDGNATRSQWEVQTDLEDEKCIKMDVKTATAHIHESWTYTEASEDEGLTERLKSFGRSTRNQSMEVGSANLRTKAGIEGSVTYQAIATILRVAGFNSNSVFLDLGSGGGEPMVIANQFNPRLVLGVENDSARASKSIELLQKHDCTGFPVVATIESISYYGPATHIWCFSKGLDALTLNHMYEAIKASPTVNFVMITDNTCPVGFQYVKQHVARMAKGKGTSFTFYVYQRIMCRDSPVQGRAHPIFLLPIYLSRFPKSVYQGFLEQYSQRIGHGEYQGNFFCGSSAIVQRKRKENNGKRKRSVQNGQ